MKYFLFCLKCKRGTQVFLEAPAGGRHDGSPYQAHDHHRHLDDRDDDHDHADDDADHLDDRDDDAQVRGHVRPARARDCEHLCQVPARLLPLPQEVPRR